MSSRSGRRGERAAAAPALAAPPPARVRAELLFFHLTDLNETGNLNYDHETVPQSILPPKAQSPGGDTAVGLRGAAASSLGATGVANQGLA